MDPGGDGAGADEDDLGAARVLVGQCIDEGDEAPMVDPGVRAGQRARSHLDDEAASAAEDGPGRHDVSLVSVP